MQVSQSQAFHLQWWLRANVCPVWVVCDAVFVQPDTCGKGSATAEACVALSGLAMLLPLGVQPRLLMS